MLLFLTSSVWALEFKDQIKNRIDQIEIKPEFKVALISMLPIFELRGAIPIGINYYKLSWIETYIFAIFGNMMPIFFILLFFRFIESFFRKFKSTEILLEKIFARTRKKGKVIEQYEEIGLVMFVAIPLPVTGAWTGSLAAYLFGLSFWKSILFIFLGVMIAGVVVTILSVLGLLGAIIAISILLILGLLQIFQLIKVRRNEKAV